MDALVKDSRIIIAGGAGYIGRHVSRFLGLHGSLSFGIGNCQSENFYPGDWGYDSWETSSIQKISSDLESRLLDFNPNIVLFAAGKGSVAEVQKSPELYLENEILSLLSLLDFCAKSDSKPLFVYLSSASVYGESEEPASENQRIIKSKLKSNYSFLKYMGELITREYSERLEVPFVILRVGTIYGPAMEKQLLHDILKQINSNADRLVLRGSPHEKRDFVFIDDLANFLLFLFQAVKSGMEIPNLLNFGTGKLREINEIVLSTISLKHFRGELEYLNNTSDINPLILHLDISKLRSLGFSCSIDLEEGLQLLVNGG